MLQPELSKPTSTAAYCVVFRQDGQVFRRDTQFPCKASACDVTWAAQKVEARPKAVVEAIVLNILPR